MQNRLETDRTLAKARNAFTRLFNQYADLADKIDSTDTRLQKIITSTRDLAETYLIKVEDGL